MCRLYVNGAVVFKRSPTVCDRLPVCVRCKFYFCPNLIVLPDVWKGHAFRPDACASGYVYPTTDVRSYWKITSVKPWPEGEVAKRRLYLAFFFRSRAKFRFHPLPHRKRLAPRHLDEERVKRVTRSLKSFKQLVRFHSLLRLIRLAFCFSGA